jgi:hypothetical protein
MYQDVYGIPVMVQLLRKRLYRAIMREVGGVATRDTLGDISRRGFQGCRRPAYQAYCSPLDGKRASNGLPYPTAGTCHHCNVFV